MPHCHGLIPNHCHPLNPVTCPTCDHLTPITQHPLRGTFGGLGQMATTMAPASATDFAAATASRQNQTLPPPGINMAMTMFGDDHCDEALPACRAGTPTRWNVNHQHHHCHSICPAFSALPPWLLHHCPTAHTTRPWRGHPLPSCF